MMAQTQAVSLPALEIRQLTKHYGRPVVSQLDLAVQQGEFYALLGHNGAGKTTTLRMIAGLLLPDHGQIRILGQDIVRQTAAAKQRMAYLPDEPMLYGKLKPYEYLEFVAGLWSVPSDIACQRAQELLQWLDLEKHSNALCEGFSRGMKQKLALAGALIHDPELLLLDEPLTGLDAHAGLQVRGLLKSLVAQGKTIVMTTHILEVAEKLADRIGILQSGQLIAEGSMTELLQRYGASSLEQVFLQQAAQQEKIHAV